MKEPGTMRERAETEADEAAPASGERAPSAEDDPRADPEIARLMAERDKFLKPGETPFDYSVDRDPTRDEAPPSEGRTYLAPKTIPPVRDHKTIPKLAVIVQLPPSEPVAEAPPSPAPTPAPPAPRDQARERPTVRRLQSPRAVPPPDASIPDEPARDRSNRLGLYFLIAAAVTFALLMFAYCGRSQTDARTGPVPSSSPTTRPTLPAPSPPPIAVSGAPTAVAVEPSASAIEPPSSVAQAPTTRATASGAVTAKKAPAATTSVAPTASAAPTSAPTARPKEIFDLRNSNDPKPNLDF